MFLFFDCVKSKFLGLTTNMVSVLCLYLISNYYVYYLKKHDVSELRSLVIFTIGLCGASSTQVLSNLINYNIISFSNICFEFLTSTLVGLLCTVIIYYIVTYYEICTEFSNVFALYVMSNFILSSFVAITEYLFFYYIFTINTNLMYPLVNALMDVFGFLLFIVFCQLFKLGA